MWWIMYVSLNDVFYFSELEESLLVLPLDYVLQLLPILETLIQESREVELACRCLFFLLRLVANHVSFVNLDKGKVNERLKVTWIYA